MEVPGQRPAVRAGVEDELVQLAQIPQSVWQPEIGEKQPC